MNIKFMLLLILSGCSNDIINIHKTLSCNPIEGVYINGINSDITSSTTIASTMTLKFSKELKINLVYNQTHGPMSDLTQSFIQKELERFPLFFLQKKVLSLSTNYEKIKSDFLAITKKKNVILISHSQGNLYANELCLDEQITKFRNVQVATPAAQINCGVNYTTLDSDEMVQIISGKIKLSKEKEGLFFKALSSGVTEAANLALAIGSNFTHVKSALPANIKQSSRNVANANEDDDSILSYLNFSSHSISNYLSYEKSFSKIKKDVNLEINQIKDNQSFKIKADFKDKTKSLDLSCGVINSGDFNCLVNSAKDVVIEGRKYHLVDSKLNVVVKALDNNSYEVNVNGTGTHQLGIIETILGAIGAIFVLANFQGKKKDN